MAYTYDQTELGPQNYTDDDYQALIGDAVSRIPLITDRLKDHNPFSPSIVILRLIMSAIDRLNYNLNRVHEAHYLPTCLLRDSQFDIVDLISYRPHMAVGGTTTLKITLGSPAVTGVTLPKFWQAKGGDFYVCTLAEASISAGQSEVEVGAVQGKSHVSSFTGTNEKYQTYIVTQEGVCRIDLTVAGEAWTEVDSTVGQTATAKVYTARLLWNGTIELGFGNGTEGAIPAQGAAIVATRVLTDGSAGNLASGVITEVVDTVMDGAEDVTANTTVTNTEPITNGDEVEQLADIKRNGPRSLHALFRMVSGNDFTSLIAAYPGVERCYTRDLNTESGDDWKYNYVEVYVVPSGGGDMSEPLKAELESYIEGTADGRKIVGSDIRLLDADYVTVNMEVDVYRYANADASTVSQAIAAVIQNWFDLDPDIGETNWGLDIDIEAIRGEMDRASGVSYTEILAPLTDPVVGTGQIAILGTLKINMKVAS